MEEFPRSHRSLKELDRWDGLFVELLSNRQGGFRTNRLGRLVKMRSAGLNDHSNVVRQLLDSLVCLAIAVTLLRTFEVEGYIISTGSMAPNLLGDHKRVVCPACKYSFAFGISRRPVESNRALAVCPNCGRRSIQLESVPPNEGDQLLVHKDAFSFASPRRWVVAVFHNSNNPKQAYVKRIVGLPGERVQIVDGDIHVDGKIQRKNLSQLRAVRIPVYEYDFRPRDDSAWQPRWRAEDGWAAKGNGFESLPTRQQVDGKKASVSWVTYRHWIRSGGTHQTSVGLIRLPAEVVIPKTGMIPLHYDAQSARLVCKGVLEPATRDRVLKMTDAADFRRALRQLEQRSHIAPITDGYGYNRSTVTSPMPVRDLMVSMKLSVRQGDGQLLIRMIDGFHVFDCVLDVGLQQARLHVDGKTEPVRMSLFAFEFSQVPVLVEMSIMDRQVLLALEDEVVLQVAFDESWNVTGIAKQRYSMKSPIQFGMHALQARVDALRLFRDVYYTGGDRRHGISEPYHLGEDEYFVLGDNSPVSVDSRSWSKAPVNGQMLLGKPFLVHLPSRPGKITIGNYVGHIRIPDVSRIRYIR